MAITRQDVAQAAGVSPAVVSYVLNKGPRPVSAAARARVQDAVRQLGYRPNAIASALSGGTTRSIGFLTPNLRDPFFAQLTEAVEHSFSEEGYLVISGSTYGDRTREERYVHAFVDRKVDGLLFSSGISIVGPALNKLEQPVLVLGEGPEQFSTIKADDALDAAYTVEHLQRHGHRLIACVTSAQQANTSAAARLSGWRHQQDQMENPAGDELVAYAEMSEEGGYLAALSLLSEHGRPWTAHGQRPTALFVTSDVQAIGAIHACHELGLNVPNDVAIVSTGGTQAAAYTIPTLTTLRQDIEFMAQEARKRLLNQIREPGNPPIHSQLRGNLVVGHSCGC